MSRGMRIGVIAGERRYELLHTFEFFWKVVPPSFLPQNERKRWINNYLEALDRVGLHFGATERIR